MANNIVVYDFYGLPGCGKSVISHRLAVMLDGKVREVSYVMDHKHSSFLRFSLKSTYSLLFCLSHRNVAQELCTLVKKCGYNNKNGGRSQRRNLLYKLYLIDKAQPTDVALLFDEGLVQASISLAMGGVISANEIYSRIVGCLPFKVELRPVCIDTPIATALHNMTLRNTNDSRVEQISSQEEKIAFLDRFQKQLDSLNVQPFVKVKVENNATPEELAKRLHDLISNINI